MDDVRPYRLRNNDTASWAYYPAFEVRCLSFIQRHKIDFDQGMFRAELRARFNDPVLDRHRLYLFLAGTRIVGHFLGWVDTAYGRPYIHVHHLDVDDGFSVKGTMAEMFNEMDAWAEALNASLQPGQNRVDKVSFWTWHEPTKFVRYLRSGCEAKVERYVVEYSLKERAARARPVPQELH